MKNRGERSHCLLKAVRIKKKDSQIMTTGVKQRDAARNE